MKNKILINKIKNNEKPKVNTIKFDKNKKSTTTWGRSSAPGATLEAAPPDKLIELTMAVHTHVVCCHTHGNAHLAAFGPRAFDAAL